jgi:CHAT domain-containing protein
LDRRTTVELFEQIRREYEHGAGTIKGVARKFKVHYIVLAPSSDSKEDGLLEAWELMLMDLKAELVVLSACDTARGRAGEGEGLVGLTWALFVAGVPTTVASQWQVPSQSTTKLMVSFHKNLQVRESGKAVSKAEA